MLVDDIKAKVTAAMKSGDTVTRDILRLALGEIQTAEARKQAPVTEEEATASVRKLIKSNEETMGLSTGDAVAALKKEIEILSALLPKQLSVEDILTALAPVKDAIVAAKADGQATGVAMKHLKSVNANVNGTDVGVAVKQLRS